jgi:hypothetical protein
VSFLWLGTEFCQYKSNHAKIVHVLLLRKLRTQCAVTRIWYKKYEGTHIQFPEEKRGGEFDEEEYILL